METQTSPISVVTPAELAKMLRVTRKTVDRMDKGGTGPRSVQLSPGRIGYRMADITEWLEQPRTRRCKAKKSVLEDA
jgi:predicted DNA-binding transcriptional regulator AlpA